MRDYAAGVQGGFYTEENGHVKREIAAQQLVRQMSPSVQLVTALEYRGPILWEPEPTDGRREGYAICPCGCGERRLFISLPLDDPTAGRGV